MSIDHKSASYSPHAPRKDPRGYQILMLLTLLACGSVFDIGIQAVYAPAIVGSALATQWICCRWLALRPNSTSALISALSLCLLLRTDMMIWAALGAMVAISSKFIFQTGDRHFFNPTNFALVVMITITDSVWVSPGQWGSVALFGFFIAGMGALVLYRSERADITLAFLFCYAAILYLRAFWLGDPAAIPWHYLQSGALLIFAFFMISDPKTIPNARTGRLLFAAVVAALAVYIQFHLYEPNGLLWALILAAPLNPVLNRLFPGGAYVWQPSGKPDYSPQR